MSDNFYQKSVVQSTTEPQKTKLKEKAKCVAELTIEFLPDAALAIDNKKCVIIWNKTIEKIR